MARPEDRVTRLVEAHAPDLLAYFTRRVEYPPDAADLLSDTLLVVWRKVRRLPDDDTEARMWMFGVARHVLSGHRRGRRRRSKLQDRLHNELLVLPSHANERTTELQSALAELEPTDLEIIRLVH